VLFRFGLILSALLIAGLPAGATAQSAASAVVQATVRPGKCPVHSRCSDKGPKVQGGTPTVGIVSPEIPVLALFIDTAAGTQPLRLTIRPAGSLHWDEMALAVSWATSIDGEQHRSRAVTLASADLPLDLSSATIQALESGLITVIVEY
jgi:hypothetical protein